MATLKTIDFRSAGLWNPRIFTPVWVRKNLAESFPDFLDEKLNGSMNPEELLVIFKYKHLTIQPDYSSLGFQIDEFSEEGLQGNIVFIKSILDKLPQTTIKAMGINFVYELKESEDSKILSVFKPVTIKSTQSFPTQYYSRKADSDYLLNISLVGGVPSGTETQLVNFNFHYPKTQKSNHFDKVNYESVRKHQQEAEDFLT